jgi:AcrR family transcriptional regulator
VPDTVGRGFDQREPDRRERLQARRATRRDELLTAAIDVIRRVGADATMEEMASAGGISKPILYRHFTDRDGLVAAISEVALAQLGAIIDAKLGAARLAGSREAFRAAIDAFFEYIEQDPEMYRFVVDQDIHRRESVTFAFSEEVAKRVAEAIREALDGAGRSPAPAEVWARGIVGMVTMTASWWVTSDSRPRGEIVDHLAELAWVGMTGSR